MAFIWTILEIVINFYEGFIETYFVYKFLTPKGNKNNRLAFTICFFTIGCLYTIMNYITIFEGIFGLLFYFTVLFIYALIMLNGSIIKKLFAAIVPLLIMSLIAVFTLNFVSSINSMSIQGIIMESGVARFTVLVLAQALFYVFVKLSLRILKTNLGNFNAAEWVVIIATLAVSIVMMFLLQLIAIKITDVTQRKYLNVLVLMIVAINIMIFYMIDAISIKHNQQKEIELLKLQEQYSKQYVSNAGQQYDSIRKIRHDLKNQLSVVYTMLADGDISSAMKHIEKNVNIICVSETIVNTENTVVNAIINAKVAVAHAVGINVSCSSVKKFEGIDDIDLLNILSNTLDNAIRACMKIPEGNERDIVLDINEFRGVFKFVVKNTIFESVLSQNHLLKTTKKDKSEHGLGIKIIREIAQKYSGRCDFFEDKNIFCCMITLKSK